MWRQNLGKKANWMPASNVFTIPGAGKNKYPGKAQEAETREEGGGGWAQKPFRARSGNEDFCVPMRSESLT